MPDSLLLPNPWQEICQILRDDLKPRHPLQQKRLTVSLQPRIGEITWNPDFERARELIISELAVIASLARLELDTPDKPLWLRRWVLVVLILMVVVCSFTGFVCVLMVNESSPLAFIFFGLILILCPCYKWLSRERDDLLILLVGQKLNDYFVTHLNKNQALIGESFISVQGLSDCDILKCSSADKNPVDEEFLVVSDLTESDVRHDRLQSCKLLLNYYPPVSVCRGCGTKAVEYDQKFCAKCGVDMDAKQM